MATILWAGQSRVLTVAETKVLVSLAQYAHTDSTAHPPSCSMGIGVLFGVERGRGLNLTTHFHLVSRLRASGYVNLVHAFRRMFN
jgi:hypothetical protein